MNLLDYAKAHADYEHALAIKPDYGDAVRGLSKAASFLGNR